MSSEPSIVARGLCKAYPLSRRPLTRLAALLAGGGEGLSREVLRGVDLDLAVGDCLGIVGRNGAGKSTLLSLIAGISRPSAGAISVNGRVAAMLQLGAGFNSEFSGRENAELMGAIYGFDARAMMRKMEAIEAFADIGAYFERPVREYSSGMYARLAFAVCANVEADILLVDEILGVGDYRFQQKCMRFLRQFRRRGIIIFVSHDEHAVTALCNKAIWLDGGETRRVGETRIVLQAYRQALSRLSLIDSDFRAAGIAKQAGPAVGDAAAPPFDPDDIIVKEGVAAVTSCRLARGRGETEDLSGGEEVTLQVRFACLRRLERPRVIFLLRNPFGQIVLAGDSRDLDGGRLPAMAAGTEHECLFRFSLPYLPTGIYPVEILLQAQEEGEVRTLDHREFGATLKILSRHVSSGMANVRLTRVELEAKPAGAVF